MNSFTSQILLFAVLFSCSNLSLAEEKAIPEKVTFNEHIASIIHQKCSGCHRPGQSGPFSLISYRDVVKRQGTINAVMESNYMPPWRPVNDEVEYSNDRRLTAYEKKLLKSWMENGTPEGDPAKKPATPDFPKGWYLGKPDLEITLEDGFEVPASGKDVFRSFVFKVDIPEDKWVKAVELRPSSSGVMHHALFFLTSRKNAERLEKKDKGFGFNGFPNQLTGTLGGYVPGTTPSMLPPDLAMSLPKGSDIIMQTHFHPIGKKAIEQSTIAIYYADKPPTKSMIGIQLPPAFGRLAGIDVPAGKKDFVIEEEFTIPVDVEAIEVGGHAHYICREMSMTAIFPDGKVMTLMDIDDWDLDWQDRYRFKERILLPKGTVLKSRLLYDNSEDNPENPNSPPQRIRWGNQSTDEMGSITLTVTPADQDNTESLQYALRKHTDRSFVSVLKRRGAGDNQTPLRVFGRPEVFKELIKNLDKNKDGLLSHAEAPPKLKPQKAFDKFDTDKSGELDANELEVLRVYLTKQ